MKIKLPFSEKIIESVPEAVFTATRGPDEESFYQKSLGSAIVRDTLLGWSYGMTLSPSEVKHILRTQQRPLLNWLRKANRHYASHMQEAMSQLQYMAEEGSNDYRYFQLLANIWFHAIHTEAVGEKLQELLEFLQEALVCDFNYPLVVDV